MNSDTYNLRLHCGQQLKFCSIINNSIFLLNGSNGSYFKGLNIIDLIINSHTHQKGKKDNSGVRQNKPPEHPLDCWVFH